MVAERDELVRQLAAAERRVQALSMLLDEEAKRLVFGLEEKASQEPPPSTERPVSLTRAMINALEKAERGLSEDDLEAAVGQAINLQDVLEAEPDAFLRALHRALHSARIKRRNGRLYSPLVLAKMERGLIPQDHSSLSTHKTIISEIERVLSRTTGVVEAKSIILSIREDAEISDRLDQNPQAAYSALSRLVDRNKAKRMDGGYVWVGEKSEQPNQQEGE